MVLTVCNNDLIEKPHYHITENIYHPLIITHAILVDVPMAFLIAFQPSLLKT